MAGLPEKSAFPHKKEDLSNIEIVFENPCLSKLR